jgi:4'-phosphopantetheinyl transferase
MIWGSCSATTYETCHLDDGIEVVVLGLDVTPDAFHASAGMLSGAERDRASRFAFDSDRRRFTVARAGLRTLLGARLGVTPEAVELAYGRNGKPALANEQADSELRFNVSHSGDVAAYAFSFGRDIGIDVENIREIVNADNIAARFFSARENESYHTLAPIDKALGFLNCWTRKEAFIKALGDGLTYSLRDFDVSLLPHEPAEIRRVGDIPGAECGWGLRAISPASGFVGACVVRTAAERVSSMATYSMATSPRVLGPA